MSLVNTSPSPPSPPKIVFIVPYRDREQHRLFFSRHMAYIMEDYLEGEYKILFIHQCDSRSFNRGAMKNIGFLMVRELYPNDYSTITLVFNDVDTMPFSKGFLQYETVPGKVKHFYGFTFALGGIVSMTAGDFEKVNGFPNFWAWGYEDNLLNYRVKILNGLEIDRSQFYPIRDKNMMHFGDGVERTINRKEFERYKGETREGIDSIKDLEYELDSATGMVHVRRFQTGVEEDLSNRAVHDIRAGSRPYGDVGKNAVGRGRVKKFMPMTMVRR